MDLLALWDLGPSLSHLLTSLLPMFSSIVTPDVCFPTLQNQGLVMLEIAKMHT